MSRDPALLASTFMANVAFLGMSWKQMLGRPTITLLATQYLLGKFYSVAFTLLRFAQYNYALHTNRSVCIAISSFAQSLIWFCMRTSVKIFYQQNPI